MTPERKAEIRALLRGTPKPNPKPTLVCRDGEIIRENIVTINLAEYERQQADRWRERERRRALDPYRLGLYGPIDEDD